ncbi:MAG: hypothetical protein EA351_09385 [Gemmatimonadales bacterium]|nr:MAG: hypothetical protein EA351_09385 [Gemmatimonadales bacterium]
MPRRAIFWALGFAVLWWTLTGPGLAGWYAGLLALLLATLAFAGLAGVPIPTIHPLGLARFIPYFLTSAVRGGVDVSLRAFSPRLPLAPDTLRYRIRLPPGAPRILFVNTISLLPGTFSAELIDDRVTVHLLSRDPGTEARLTELERRVGGLFGLTLDAPPEVE